MKVSICDEQSLMNRTDIHQVERKLASALSKFGSRIESVEIRVGEVAGPKDRDKRACQLIVRLGQFDPVVVDSSDDSLTKAVSQSVARAERTIARRVSRRSSAGVRSGSNLGFA